MTGSIVVRPSCADSPLSEWYTADVVPAHVRAKMRRVCASCPLLEPCARYVREQRPRSGFYAGRFFGGRIPRDLLENSNLCPPDGRPVVYVTAPAALHGEAAAWADALEGPGRVVVLGRPGSPPRHVGIGVEVHVTSPEHYALSVRHMVGTPNRVLVVCACGSECSDAGSLMSAFGDAYLAGGADTARVVVDRLANRFAREGAS